MEEAALILAVTALSITVTKSRLFEGFRNWVSARFTLLGELVSCPYCFSHWAAAGLMWWTGFCLPIGYVVTWLALVGASAVVTKRIVP